jgi:hypothetical protein
MKSGVICTLKGCRLLSRHQGREAAARLKGKEETVTIYDLLDRVNDVRQRHADIGEWTMHVEVPDGCNAWTTLALEEITVDAVNKRILLRAWSDEIDGPETE